MSLMEIIKTRRIFSLMYSTTIWALIVMIITKKKRIYCLQIQSLANLALPQVALGPWARITYSCRSPSVNWGFGGRISPFPSWDCRIPWQGAQIVLGLPHCSSHRTSCRFLVMPGSFPSHVFELVASFARNVFSSHPSPRFCKTFF